jgi:hypothetical protein
MVLYEPQHITSYQNIISFWEKSTKKYIYVRLIYPISPTTN